MPPIKNSVLRGQAAPRALYKRSLTQTEKTHEPLPLHGGVKFKII
jgi:hypothetical protein